MMREKTCGCGRRVPRARNGAQLRVSSSPLILLGPPSVGRPCRHSVGISSPSFPGRSSEPPSLSLLCPPPIFSILAEASSSLPGPLPLPPSWPPCLQSQPFSTYAAPEGLPTPCPSLLISPPWFLRAPRTESQPLSLDFEALRGLCSPHSSHLSHVPLLPPELIPATKRRYQHKMLNKHSAWHT